MNIFTYSSLKTKACREIERLIQSEMALDLESPMDHALNAAFTIYHLVQWRQEAQNSKKTSVHEFIMSTQNQGLQILHSVVTRNKHATVSKEIFKGETQPKFENNIVCIAAEDGKLLTTEASSYLITQNSRVNVYFGDQRAVDVLREALSEFV